MTEIEPPQTNASTAVVVPVLRNAAIIALFLLGLSPQRLARWYLPHRG